jgi:hypothetical protein
VSIFYISRPGKCGAAGRLREPDIDGLPGNRARRIGGGIIGVPSALELNCVGTGCE